MRTVIAKRVRSDRVCAFRGLRSHGMALRMMFGPGLINVSWQVTIFRLALHLLPSHGKAPPPWPANHRPNPSQTTPPP